MKRPSSAAAEEGPRGVVAKKKRQKPTKRTAPVEEPMSLFAAAEEKGPEEGGLDEAEGEDAGVVVLGAAPDVCQALMGRYARSSAPQHRHLCASAAAMRSILLDEGLPLTPPTYFAAAIAAVCDADRDSLAALSAFISVLLPLVPTGSISSRKAGEAASSLVALFRESDPESLAAPTVRSLVGSLALLLQSMNLDDWSVVKLPLRVLLRFSVDRRPKVRRCAQVSTEKVFRTLKSAIVVRKASKVVVSLFHSYVPLAMDFYSFEDDSKSKNLENSIHIEVLHVLNLMNLIIPQFPQKIISRFLSEIYQLFSCHFSLLTRNILKILEVLLQQFSGNVLDSEVGNIMSMLTSYLSFDGKNPNDTLLSASTIIRDTMRKIHDSQPSIWIKHLTLVFNSLAGLLIQEHSVAKLAADILRELINQFPFSSDQPCDDLTNLPEAITLKSLCASCENVLSCCNSIPNEHILTVISDLFLKLGECSHFFMKGILLKLALWMTETHEDSHSAQFVQECLGAAVVSMGPEKLLLTIPIVFDMEKLSCSNTGLIPILKNYTVGASLQFFEEYIMPVARSARETCKRVHRLSIKRNLLSCADGLWSLLPAFCHYPADTSRYFSSLAKVLVKELEEDPSVHEHVAAAIKELVNGSRSAAKNKEEANNMHYSAGVKTSNFSITSRSASYHYSAEVAQGNLKVLTSSSMKLLMTLVNIFLDSSPEKRAYLKETIECLASILDSSIIRDFFSLTLTRLGLVEDDSEQRKIENHVQQSDGDGERRKLDMDKMQDQRCLMVELATALLAGADKDLVKMVYYYIKPCISANDIVLECGVYQTLGRILKENSWFVIAEADELMNLLLGLESPVEERILQFRFSCLRFLFAQLLKNTSEETNTKALLVLNEIIRFLKDSKEDIRKIAYGTLLDISCSLKDSTSAREGPSLSHHQQLFAMIMGYFSGSPPHIMSGAVSALSLLIYNDTDLYHHVPNLVPSVLLLLQNKANEIIKAVLGLIKVLVSCLPVTEIKKLLPDIMNGILPWSSVSKNHFRSKVRVIVEIVTRKCGTEPVLLPDKFKDCVRSVTEHSTKKASQTHSSQSKTVSDSINPSFKRMHSERKNGQRKKQKHGDGQREKQKQGYQFSTESYMHPGNIRNKELMNKLKRKSGDGSWLPGKQHVILDNHEKRQVRKKEPKRNNKIKPRHGKRRGKKNATVR